MVETILTPALQGLVSGAAGALAALVVPAVVAHFWPALRPKPLRIVRGRREGRVS